MFESLPSLLPLHFFELFFDAKYVSATKRRGKLGKEHLINPTGKYFDEEDSLEFFLGWNEKGIIVQAEIYSENIEIDPSEFRRGDSIELFFDTRNLKSQGYVSKFCHHFVVFPELADNFYIKEVTRFRNEDMHILASPNDFDVNVEIGKKSYFADIFIPSKCLYGFDPSRFDKLGFTYRVNRKGKDPIHFSLSSMELSVERNPYFWATVNLIK